VIYKARAESPKRNFQPSDYHRRSAFTDFFSHTLKPNTSTERAASLIGLGIFSKKINKIQVPKL
ncbi:MAG: hypothetical protein KHX84_24245, partial [Enterocloster asparagiformis]|nr:hypothetical protein [Enterocloster asparagiformis]